MLATWHQRERRDGIVVKEISFPVPPPSQDDLADRIERAITPRTKVIHVCHITNLTGQIFPIRKIVQLARARGIEVIVDGAHAYAHFPFTRDELACVKIRPPSAPARRCGRGTVTIEGMDPNKLVA